MLALSEILELKSLLEECEHIELEMYLGLCGVRLFSYDYLGVTDLLLSVSADTFVVKRICLRYRHIGTLDTLFNLLRKLARCHGVYRIVIDYAYTAEMVKWCKHHGLLLDDSSKWIVNGIEYGRYTYPMMY